MKQSNNLEGKSVLVPITNWPLRNLKIFYLACGYLWNKIGERFFFLMKLNWTILIESFWKWGPYFKWIRPAAERNSLQTSKQTLGGSTSLLGVAQRGRDRARFANHDYHKASHSLWILQYKSLHLEAPVTQFCTSACLTYQVLSSKLQQVRGIGSFSVIWWFFIMTVPLGKESFKKKSQLNRLHHIGWYPLKVCKHPLWSLKWTTHPGVSLGDELWKDCAFQIIPMATFNILFFFPKRFQPRLYSDFPFSAVCSFWKCIFIYSIIY